MIAQNFLIDVTLISRGMFKSPALFTARPSPSIVLNFRGIAQGDTFDVAGIKDDTVLSGETAVRIRYGCA